MRQMRQKARERLKPGCRVCPICNGVACAGEVPGMGGKGTGASFHNNIKALERHRLLMRVLHEADVPDTSLTLWGRRFALPVIAAPVGSIAVNLKSDLSDEDYVRGVIRGCREAGAPAGLGDTTDIRDFTRNMDITIEEAAADVVIPFIKPWGAEEVEKRLDMAARAGVSACGMDVDAVGLVRFKGAPIRVKRPKALALDIRKAHERGMKFIVKGIMTAAEAVTAADAGADAVLVSNHGGRVLDYSPGTAEMLPAVAEAVGARVTVLMDGGVRSGADMLKALALGAKAVLICRPVIVAVHGDEEQGLSAYFATLKEELVQSMRLTGCADLASISRRVLC